MYFLKKIYIKLNMNLKRDCIFIIFICIGILCFLIKGFQLSDESTTYDIMVHEFGAQLVIDNISTYHNVGDVIDNKFIWYHEYKPYTGIYHLDTGSHLLIDMVSEIDKSTINQYLNDDTDFSEYDGNYRYIQCLFMVNLQ